MANVGTLINASPDLRAQIQNNRQLQPACFSWRERSPFTLIATAATLAAVAGNPMFGGLGSDVMWRRAITPGEGFSLGGGTNAELFIVPGKVPLYLEGDNPDIASESAANVGVEISACAKRLVYAPGLASITPAPGA
jgi:pyrroloquinoline quinone biosynthesis protein B